MMTTWSESQRMGRLTCSMISGVKSSSDDSCSAIDSVRVEVARVEGYDLAVLGAVAEVEVIRTDGGEISAPMPNNSLDAVLHVLVVGDEDLVERLLQQAAVLETIDGGVLRAVVDPYVEHGGVALAASHFLGDLAAALVCSIQKRRIPVGVRQRGMPLLGCENDVELKSSFAVGSRPTPSSAWRSARRSASRSTAPVAWKSA